MPRDSNGVYTLPTGNPVITQTLITSSWANRTMSDIAQALTDSLTDAPIDSKQYARRSGVWAEVVFPLPPDLTPYVKKAGDIMSGDLGITRMSPTLNLNKTAVDQFPQIVGTLNGVFRWGFHLGNNSPETGGNNGSDFALYRGDDAGNAFQPASLYINRNDGIARMPFNRVYWSGTFDALGAVNPGPIYFPMVTGETEGGFTMSPPRLDLIFPVTGIYIVHAQTLMNLVGNSYLELRRNGAIIRLAYSGVAGVQDMIVSVVTRFNKGDSMQATITGNIANTWGAQHSDVHAALLYPL